MTLLRRTFLGLAAVPFTHGAEDSVSFTDYPADFRVDVQAATPRVKLFDWRSLTSLETPADAFFTFHQTTVPRMTELRSWRLEISGAVARPRTLTYADLQRHGTAKVAAVIECAGNNGHSRLMNGLISNAEWSGVPLAPLLRGCGILPEAREVVFFGADTETERKWPAGDREMQAPHARSVFVQDALEGGALLAMSMNGRSLPPEHGFPVRLILPGWYGMAHVKWLDRIVVLDRRYEGRHMSRNYHSIRDVAGLLMETSISRNRLKSVVARISDTRITGAAWGDAERVQVRVDDQAWENATIAAQAGLHAWVLWQAPLPGLKAGPHTVVSRAIDGRGNIQPERSGSLSSREDNSQWPRRILVRG